MDVRTELHADCANCFALCCVALQLSRGADFGFDKPAGTPCANLAADLRCTIHAELRSRGFPGCAAFDCQGAGQKVSLITFGGRSWRGDERTAQQLVVLFPIVRQLHEMLGYLVAALDVPAADGMRTTLVPLRDRIDALTYLPPDELVDVDPAALRREVGALLEQVSELARAPLPGPSHRGADLAGARLRGARLDRADLRGALLIRADLRAAQLCGADLLGADLRDADLRGADLTGALFVTSAQLHAARGDAATRLPAGQSRPAHWST
jgi:hypothetical protein